MASSGWRPATRPVAHSIRAATSAPATQRPRVAASWAALMAAPVASGTVAPAIPALTAAATAAAPARARLVPWVTKLAWNTASTRVSRAPGEAGVARFLLLSAGGAALAGGASGGAVPIGGVGLEA